jgi:hypothetical protein
MERTLKFKTDKATDWYITKEFADDKHMRNFIAYVCRTKKGYTLDEVFINQTEYKTCDRCCYDIVDNDGDIMEHVCTDEIELNSREDNKLIAEFMGLSIKEGVCYYTDADDMFPMGIEVEEPHLPYDTSWDWLMPVCQQIDKYLEDNISLIGYFDDCLRSNDIDVRYQAVVEFINQLDN